MKKMLKFIKNLFNLKDKSMKYKITFGIMSLFYILVLGICLISINIVSSTDYYMLTPGDASEVKNVIEIDSIHDTGKVYTLSVYEFRRLSILQYLLAKLEPEIAINEDYESYLSNEELAIQGNIMKENSITNAIIVAYKAASKKNSNVMIDEYFQGVIIHTTYEYTDKKIKQGDIITKINNQAFTDVDGYVNLVDQVIRDKANKTIILTIIRNKQEMELEVKINETNAGRKIGIAVYPHHVIRSATPKYTVHKSSSSGPSGGLMQTLAIYNALTAGDLTRGKNIMGTGTIEVDGSVGSIGGVKQKIITANNYKADYVFIPSENYQDALDQYKLLKNPSYPTPIKVDKFDDVLKFFEGLGD